jgi:hypothetical protein
MTAIQLQKDWSINPNVRNAYVSLADMSGWYIYQNHAWLKAHNWTVKFTCDGTTGPANISDNTDRLLSKSDADTRGANAAAAQSYTVLQNPDGVQLMFTFQGATDDVIRISYSPGGLFTVVGGGSAIQPTASDEVVFCQGNSVVNGGTSLDRVMTIWAADDGTAWSNILFRNNATQTMLGFEKVNSACAPGVFTQPYFAYRYNTFERTNNPTNLSAAPTADPHSVAAGAAGWFGGMARVFTLGAVRSTRVGAGTLAIAYVQGQSNRIIDTFLSNAPALQNGTMPLLPWFLTGEKASALDGFLGTPIDWWIGYSGSLTVPAFNDFIPGFDPGDVPGVSGGQTGIGDVRTNWFIAIGSTVIRPWKNAAPNIQSI